MTKGYQHEAKKNRKGFPGPDGKNHPNSSGLSSLSIHFPYEMVILGKHSGQTHKGVPSTNDGVVIPMANCRSAVPVSNEKHRYMDTMSTQNDEIQLAGVLM